jgi:hypothetical protein
MMWMYTLPLWVLAALIVGTSVAVAWSACLTARRLHWVIPPDDQGPAGVLHGFVGVLYAVALALIVVNVQGSYAQVEQAVMHEASAAGNLYRDLDGIGEPARTTFQMLTREYLDSAIAVEWPLQQRGEVSEATWAIVDKLAHDVAVLWPAAEHDRALMPELLTDISQLLDRRRERLFVGQQGIGTTLWIVIVLGSIVTIGYACAFQIHSLRTHLAVTGLMAVMFGLMAFLIVAMDHPLWGHLSVGPDALVSTRANIARLTKGTR